MAIRIEKTPLIEQESNFIGIKLPLDISTGREGYFESTILTVEAGKEDLRNLLFTRKGERVFQPQFGLDLQKFIFENMGEDSLISIQEEITETVNTWLPHVGISNIDINGVLNMNDISHTNENTITIKVQFYLHQFPNVFDSIDLVINR